MNTEDFQTYAALVVAGVSITQAFILGITLESQRSFKKEESDSQKPAISVRYEFHSQTIGHQDLYVTLDNIGHRALLNLELEITTITRRKDAENMIFQNQSEKLSSYNHLYHGEEKQSPVIGSFSGSNRISFFIYSRINFQDSLNLKKLNQDYMTTFGDFDPFIMTTFSYLEAEMLNIELKKFIKQDGTNVDEMWIKNLSKFLQKHKP